jgi:uncharacterized repeat protein (TIGR03803 family)
MTPLFRNILLGSALLGVPAAMAAPATQGVFTPVYAFPGGAGGSYPNAPLVFDHSGNLYGTTQEGGEYCQYGPAFGCGTVFRLDSQGHLTTLHTFTGGADGFEPRAGLLLMDGRLYGSTYTGTLFSLKPDGSDYTVIEEFPSYSRANLEYELLPAPGGGVYGISYISTGPGNGFLFLWEPKDTLFTLHRFTGGADGGAPTSLVEDQAGNLFGSTQAGGSCAANPRHGCGVVFKVDHATRAFSVLYTFTGGSDGAQPLLGSVDASGTVHGAAQPTELRVGNGLLFSLVPSGSSYRYVQGSGVFTGSPLTVTSGPVPGPGNTLVGTSYGALYFDLADHVFSAKTSILGNFIGPEAVTPDGTIYGVAKYYAQGSYGTIYSFTHAPAAQ